MNKKTIVVDSETYQRIIQTMKESFDQSGVHYQHNVRIATVLVLEYNLGLRVGDILQLKMDSFVRDGERYRLDIYEEKTGKCRDFTVPDDAYWTLIQLMRRRDTIKTHQIRLKNQLHEQFCVVYVSAARRLYTFSEVPVTRLSKR